MGQSRLFARRLLAVAAAVVLLSQAASAAAPPGSPDADLLPPASVPADAIGVSWLDLRPMDGPTIAATTDALAPLAGGEDDQYLQFWNALADVAGSLRGAGVEVVVVPLDQSLVMGEAVEPAGRDAPAARPATGPAGVAAVYFLRLRPGADRAAVEAACRGSFRRLAAVAGDAERAPDPEKVRFRPRGTRWLDVLPNPSAMPPDGDAATTGRFAAALADALADASDGPALRLAVVPSAAARQQLTDAAQDPSAAPFRGAIDGLRTMDHATVGMTVGAKPQWTAALRLPDAASAARMKQAIDAATALAGLSLANTDDPRYAEYVRAQLSLANLEQDGPRLSRTVTIPTLLRIKQLGQAGEGTTQEMPPK